MAEANASVSDIQSWAAEGQGVAPQEREQEIETQGGLEREIEVHHEPGQETEVRQVPLPQCRILSGEAIRPLAHRTAVRRLSNQLSLPMFLNIKIWPTQRWKFVLRITKKVKNDHRCAKSLHCCLYETRLFLLQSADIEDEVRDAIRLTDSETPVSESQAAEPPELEQPADVRRHPVAYHLNALEVLDSLCTSQALMRVEAPRSPRRRPGRISNSRCWDAKKGSSLRLLTRRVIR